nr:MAG TPA: 30S ribosomal protein S2 [Caudoviricetes sp.]
MGKDKNDYICDDRVYAPGGLMDQIRGMSDEEFQKHIAELREKEEQNKE